MHIEVRRRWFSDKSTISEVSLNGEFECYGLEDRVRAVGIKIDHATAIAAGTYTLVVDFSNRFQRYMPHVLDVPQFDGIRVHSGNTDVDTDGCLLVGQEKSLDCVLMSRVAFSQFFAKIAIAVGMDDSGRVIYRIREDTDVVYINDPESDTRTPEFDLKSAERRLV